MNPELKRMLENLESGLDEAVKKLNDKFTELEKDSLTEEEKKSIKEELPELIKNFKNLQEAFDKTLIQTVPTAGKAIEDRKAMNVEIRAAIKEAGSNGGSEIPFAYKSVQTTEVAGLGGIITRTETRNNVIEFPQSSLEFINRLGMETIGGKSLTLILEDPNFDSNLDDLTEDQVDAFWTGENETAGSNDPEKFEELEIPVHKCTVTIKLTNEMIEDEEIDILAYIQRKVDMRFSFKQLLGFTKGSGVKSPKGFLNDDRVEVVNAASVTAATLWGIAIDLEHAVSEMYRSGGSYVMNDRTWAFIKKIEDNEGRPLLVRGMNIIDATENTLNGYPVDTNVAMPSDITTSGMRPMSFGNFSAGYTRVMRKQMSFILDNITKKGYTEIYFDGRVGGSVTSKKAISVLEIS